MGTGSAVERLSGSHYPSDMIIRCTGRARKRMRLELTDTADTGGGSPSLKEWYCNCVVLQRRPFFLVTHAQTLFSFWMPVAGHANRPAFSVAMRKHARKALAEVGVDEVSAATVLDEGPDLFSRTSDRGVLGSMVDLAHVSKAVVAHRGGLAHVSLDEMNRLMNRSPMSKLGMQAPDQKILRAILGREHLAERGQ